MIESRLATREEGGLVSGIPLLQLDEILPPLAMGFARMRHLIQVGIFMAWGAALGITLVTYLLFKDPALLAERAKGFLAKGEPLWDKVFMLALTASMISFALIIRLDLGRFHWSPELPLVVNVGLCRFDGHLSPIQGNGRCPYAETREAKTARYRGVHPQNFPFSSG